MKKLLAFALFAAASSALAQPKPDLAIKALQFVDPDTGAVTRVGAFGSPGRMLVTATNQGTAEARDFAIAIAFSVDTQLTFSNDPIVLDYPVTVLAAGATATYDISFTIPLSYKGVPLTTGNYYAFAVLDSLSVLNELDENNNKAAAPLPGLPAPVVLREPGPDLVVTRLEAPRAAGVGEIAQVLRTFRNAGSRPAPPVKYRYYLSANADITTSDLPVKIVAGDGTMADFGTVSLAVAPDPMSVEAASERVLIPASLTPGTWYLGAVLDPDSLVTEIEETNNSLGSSPITVAGSALRIVTSQLPDAVAGRPYSFQLVLSGDVASQPTVWGVDALPMDLMLNTSTGLLSGTPKAETVVGITVSATNAGRTAVTRLALRVLPTTSQVEITTTSLPPVINDPLIAYETWLGAAGGVKPYTWRIVPVAGEVLPADLRFAATGRLSGNPRAATMEKAYPLTFEVRDLHGSVAVRKLNVRVIARGAIQFASSSVPDALVGEMYLADLGVRAVAGSPPLVKPLSARVVNGQLPEGLSLSVASEALLLEGTPQVAGFFAFTLEVEDQSGRNDSTDFLLRVFPRRLVIDGSMVPATLQPGDPVDFRFAVTGATTDVKYELYSGALPPGLSLSASGQVTGAVAPENAEGTHDFTLRVTDGMGGTGLGSYAIRVERERVEEGCSAAPSGLMVLAALAFAVRRRRFTGTGR